MTDNEVIISVLKDKKKYKIITEKKEYLISEDTLLKFLLFKGKLLTSDEINEVILYETKLGIFNKCLNRLSYSSRSIYEMRLYLDKISEDLSITDAVLKRLIDLGYLDDKVYAIEKKDYVIRNKKGPRFLSQILKETKVEASIIQDVILEYSEDLEQEIIQDKVEKLVLKNTSEPIIKQKLKLQNKLIRDGFNSSLINEVLRGLEFVDDSKESLLKEISKLNKKYSDQDSVNKKKKMINNLMSKGYSYSDISQSFNGIDSE